MSALPPVRSRSPMNTVVRTCNAREDAAHRVFLNCCLFNLLQNDLDPKPGQTTGFFMHQDLIPFELYCQTVPKSTFMPVARGIFSNPMATWVTYKIIAQKKPQKSQDNTTSDENYFIVADVVAVGAEGNVVAEGDSLTLVLGKPVDSQQKWDWDHMDFCDILELLRWASKVKYDSHREMRTETEASVIAQRLQMYGNWDITFL